MLTSRSAHSTWKSISDIADVLIPKATNREGFIEECRSGAFEGAIVAYRTFDSFSLTGKIDKDVVSALPKSLKFICHNGTFLVIHVRLCKRRYGSD